MPKQYYRKALVSHLFTVRGQVVPFEVLAGNSGVIELNTEDPGQAMLCEGLDAAAAANRSGVVKITADEYLALKKKRPLIRSAKPTKEVLRVLPVSPSPFSRISKPSEKAAGDAPPAVAVDAAKLTATPAAPQTPAAGAMAAAPEGGTVRIAPKFVPSKAPLHPESPPTKA